MASLRIGDLARLGGVSVRMLRHYHEIGLLEPVEVDHRTGYRLYERRQLATLRRIVDLKDVGIALDDIRRALDRDEMVETEELLVARRAALEQEISDATDDLAVIDRLLAGQHRKAAVSTIEVELKAIPGRLVAQRSAVAESWAPKHIGPVIRPLYPELLARLESASIPVVGPSTAWYEDTDDGRVAVHATLTIAHHPPRIPDGIEIVELPSIELAATTIHRGTMDDCDVTYEALLAWIEAEGHEPIGYSRELDIECGPDTQWITELQLEIRPS